MNETTIYNDFSFYPLKALYNALIFKSGLGQELTVAEKDFMESFESRQFIEGWLK
jgi:hypothetical protein